MNPFILHIRLTKSCNAHCTYCSAWQNNPDKFMDSDSCIESLSYVFSIWEKLNINVDFISIEYVGGEVLLIPIDEIIKTVKNNRIFFTTKNITVHDGVQTNLIGNYKDIKSLYELFSGRVGTSIDDVTEQRQINGSHEKYKTIMMTNEKRVINNFNNKPIPGVFVIDQKSYPFSEFQIKKSIRENRNIVLRPLFKGGLSESSIDDFHVEKVMLDAINAWFMKSLIIIEPIYGLLKNRLQHKHGYDLGHNLSFCYFMSDCAKRSLCLEPNGDLYICFELADHGYGKLGNALEKTFDFDLWEKLDQRPNKLHDDCIKCEYLNECRGGCMMHSIEHNQDIYGKTPYCNAWKAIFAKLDELIELHSSIKVMDWINRIEDKQRKEAC